MLEKWKNPGLSEICRSQEKKKTKNKTRLYFKYNEMAEEHFILIIKKQ